MRVAGFGFRHNASLASFQAALALTGGADALTTVDTKLPGLTALAQATGLPLIPVTHAAIALHKRPGSNRVKTLYGTGSVAESAALAAAGPGASLTQPRRASPDGQVVIAIAEVQP